MMFYNLVFTVDGIVAVLLYLFMSYVAAIYTATTWAEERRIFGTTDFRISVINILLPLSLILLSLERERIEEK